MSVEEKWFACYYHYNNISLVRVFDLDTGAELLSSEVEPVYRKDMESRPFHAGDHGRKLYLCSSGVQHVLDLDSPAPTWSRKRSDPNAGRQHYPSSNCGQMSPGTSKMDR